MRNRRGVLAPALVLLLATGCSPMDSVMHAIFGRSMRDQNSFDPYENTLPPPELSVPYSGGNYSADPYGYNIGQKEPLGEIPAPITLVDVAPPGSEAVNSLVNPVPADEASLARGEVMYNRYCAVCHGATGVSEGAPMNQPDRLPQLAAFNLALPTPGLDNAYRFTDGYIYSVIRIGRGAMPRYGDRIGHYDRWHIVNYVRKLQQDALAAQGGVGN